MEPMGNGDPAVVLTGAEEEKMKKLTQRQEPERDQVWHSDCHLADFPLGLHFLLPVEDISSITQANTKTLLMTERSHYR